MADLRLDIAEEALASAISAGDASDSELIARIVSTDPDEVMPPPHANKKALTPAEIETFKNWIDQGAKFQTHWAYEKPVRPAEPKLETLQDWAQTPIDRFVAANLEQVGWAPSKSADKRTLIRRIYFDLIGLPPTPEQVDAFVADDSPEAFENVVDQVLASKSFGERMAVFWLDQVRYADTNGIHGDNHRDHSLYRDYVIRAFNNNMPFDRFTVEQLAGDLLPNRTTQQWVASGYNRLNMTTREGGAQAKEYRAKYAADRVRNASIVWMGSTLGCAECHDHKYDPFVSRDFYRFAAFFADIEETAVGQQAPVRLPTPQQESELAELNQALQAAKEEFERRSEDRDQQFEAFVAELKTKVGEQQSVWIPQTPESANSSGDSILKIEDEIVTSTGGNPAQDNYSLTFDNLPAGITGFRLEVLADSAFPNQSVGRGNGNIVLTQVEVEQEGKPLKIKSAIADFSQKSHDVSLAIDNKKETGWAVSGHTQKQNRAAVFVLDKAVEGPEPVSLVVRLKHESVYPQHNIGKFRISFTTKPKPGLNDQDKYPGDVVAILKVDSAQRTEQDNQKLYRYFMDHGVALDSVRKRYRQLQDRKAAIKKAFRPVLVTKRIQRRPTRVLPRGNWLDDSGPIVKPGVPSFLQQIELDKPEEANRYHLAQWIVDPENPLTARVFVNRLWKLAFGEGLVRTPDDFGSQGMVPTHPKLMDYLAVEFVDSGWDVKKMIKSIVMSRTYRQSSHATDEMLKKDPANLNLARQNRFRLNAEFVRDNALAISGLLVDQIGGQSVKPYQPAGYWEHLNFPRRTYQASKDDNQYRRGLYTYWCRTFLHPSMAVFDAPSREETCVQRPRSNTPLQALVLLNDPSYVEAAQALAENLMGQAEGDKDRIRFAYRQALNREPSTAELQVLLGVLKKHRAEYSADPQAAAQAIQTGIRVPSKELDPVDLASWTSVARIVLNLHETITRY